MNKRAFLIGVGVCLTLYLTGGWVNAVVGAGIVIVVWLLVRDVTFDPTPPDQSAKANKWLTGDPAYQWTSGIKDEPERGKRPKDGFFASIQQFVGAALGIALLSSIGIGTLALLLSPGSCSTNADQEFRAL